MYTCIRFGNVGHNGFGRHEQGMLEPQPRLLQLNLLSTLISSQTLPPTPSVPITLKIHPSYLSHLIFFHYSAPELISPCRDKEITFTFYIPLSEEFHLSVTLLNITSYFIISLNLTLIVLSRRFPPLCHLI